MKLTTKDQRLELLTNGLLNARRLAEGEEIVHVKPVVRLFAPWNAATWLLSEIDPEDEDIAFGLCDLGMGCPELGSVRLSEVASVRGPAGLRIERDRHFQSTNWLWVYHRAATAAGYITDDQEALHKARKEVMKGCTL